MNTHTIPPNILYAIVHAIPLICAITGSYYGCLMSIYTHTHCQQWYIFHSATPYHTYQHFWNVHDSQRWWIVLISAIKHNIFKWKQKQQQKEARLSTPVCVPIVCTFRMFVQESAAVCECFDFDTNENSVTLSVCLS